jgi:hypothetical protein
MVKRHQASAGNTCTSCSLCAPYPLGAFFR